LALPAAILGFCTCSAELTGSDDAADELVAVRHGDLVLGTVVFACGDWVKGAPTTVKVLDLFFGRRSAAESNTGPTATQLAAVRNAGGEIVHEYAVMAVRAVIPRGGVVRLAQQISLNHARAVPNPNRFDLGVTVGYRGDGLELRQQFEKLSGHVDDVLLNNLPAFHGIISDSAIPLLQQRSDVRYVQHDQVGCLL
jgi:hypothetical protein